MHARSLFNELCLNNAGKKLRVFFKSTFFTLNFAGLKKVTDDMKTHKNPTLRQGPKPFKAAAPQTAPKPGKPAVQAPAAAAKKPPVFELQDKRWAIVSKCICRAVCSCFVNSLSKRSMKGNKLCIILLFIQKNKFFSMNFKIELLIYICFKDSDPHSYFQSLMWKTMNLVDIAFYKY